MRNALQAAFRTMLRDRVAPALRELGLKGSATRYRLEGPGYWAWVEFRPRTSNARDRITFTIDLHVVERADWEVARREWPTLPEEPASRVPFVGHSWRENIGKLLVDDRGYHWEMVEGTDPAPLADEVLAALRDHGLPAIRARAALRVVREPDGPAP